MSIAPPSWLTHLFPALAFVGAAGLAAPAAGPSGPTLPSPEERAALPPDGGPDWNRLIHESSPYLLQHAGNPVDWYPWGREARERARREDKPIFLSVGYSSCHWCHVMEHESFENPEVADLLNSRFVSVKVDREVLPDVDDVYMTATQLMTGRGGWPNSVWLLPDGRPFMAGTYYPRDDFLRLLTNISRAWDGQRKDLEDQAERLSEAIRQSGQIPASAPPPAVELETRLLDHLKTGYDPVHGGFSRAPKFPPHSVLRYLLNRAETVPDDDAHTAMALHTLDRMAQGGIHDQVGGGFHRYATDATWLLPHFEKMLYDNAQLLRVYAQAYQQTSHPVYRRVAERMVTWLLRDMHPADDGFYAALDADSDGEEGTFYVWTLDELKETLGDRAEAFARLYGATPEGNYRDEATHRRTGANVLHLEAFPEQFPDRDLAKLEQQRRQRVPPGLDTKVLTGWNGLLIGALAYGGRVLEQPDWVRLAEQTADRLLSRHRNPEGRLLRMAPGGGSEVPAYLDDTAYLADGLLDLHEATQDSRWLTEARALADALKERFHDGERGGFFTTADDHERLITRNKEGFDREIPSPNAVAARVFYRLFRQEGQQEDLDTARQTLTAFLPLLVRAPGATASFVDLTRIMGTAPGETESGIVTWTLQVPETLSAGSEASCILQAEIKGGWHINAHRPGPDHLVPLSVSVTPSQSLEMVGPDYPEGHPLTLKDVAQTVLVHTNRVRVPIKVRTGQDLPVSGTLTVEVRWQACDEERCLLPESKTLSAEWTRQE